MLGLAVAAALGFSFGAWSSRKFQRKKVGSDENLIKNLLKRYWNVIKIL